MLAINLVCNQNHRNSMNDNINGFITQIDGVFFHSRRNRYCYYAMSAFKFMFNTTNQQTKKKRRATYISSGFNSNQVTKNEIITLQNCSNNQRLVKLIQNHSNGFLDFISSRLKEHSKMFWCQKINQIIKKMYDKENHNLC